MKRRKGFGKINIEGELFQFNWATHLTGPILILYNKLNKKIEIPTSVWELIPDSDEYKTLNILNWHGKHKQGPEYGYYGKRQARELYLKYKILQKTMYGTL